MEQYRILDEEALPPPAQGAICMPLSWWTDVEPATLAREYSFFRVNNETDIAHIIRPPNAEDNDPVALARIVNGGRTPPPVSVGGVFGKLVSVGFVHTVYNNGTLELMPPGRYWMCSCMSSWGRRHALGEDAIVEATLSVLRVRRGQIGLAMENGKPVLLAEGLHCYNSPMFAFSGFRAVNETHIEHGSYHVIRVPKGSFAIVTEEQRAKLLPEGVHVIDNPIFKFEGLVKASQPYIKHGTIHVIQVPKGAVGLVFESSFPRFLHEGLHLYDSPTLEWKGTRLKLDEDIKHGTLSRFRVPKGRVGLAWKDNHPLFIETPGTYEVDSASFKYIESKPVTAKVIELGSCKTVTVYSGEVGVSFNMGVLEIMPPGRHVIDSAQHAFDDFMSTQQRALRLQSNEHRGPGELLKPQDDILVCETKDLVKIGIRADVFFRVADPMKAILQVGRDKIDSLVMETSIATLTNILRSTPLSDIAQSSSPTAVSEAKHVEKVEAANAAGEPTAPLFFDQAHDAFLSKLHDYFMEKYGIEISNIRIEQFKIMDQSLATSISQQAIMTAETQSRLANVAGQTEIATQEQERDARMRQITAKAEAETRRVAAEAEVAQAEAGARAARVRAEAEADRARIAAEGEANAIKIRAEASVAEANAEAEGIRVRADAEAERAKKLATPLGEKLSLLNVYADVVKASNEGVSKVVYVDPTTTQAANPLGLLTLQSLQSDLAVLSGDKK